MQKRAITTRVEDESNVASNRIVTKLGTVRQLTGRTYQGPNDDGSQTKDNDRYQT